MVKAFLVSLLFAHGAYSSDLIKRLSTSKSVSLFHTTREATPTFTDKAVVPGFEAFPAGRFAASFQDEKGESRFLVIETENKVGHFQPVVPGKTKIDGYIAESKDSEFQNLGSKFSEREKERFMKALIKNWGRPDTINDKDKKAILLAVAAVYSNGEKAKLLKALK